MIKNLRTKTTLRILATKKVTDVATFDFRSLQEIKEFTNSVRTEFNEDNKKFDALKKVLAANHSIVTAITIKKLDTNTKKGVDNKTPEFVKPNMDKLNKAFDIVDKYQDKIDSLDSVINILSMEFKGEKGSSNSLKELKTLRSVIKSKLDAAYKFLSDLANNHEPKSFKVIVDTVVDKITNTFNHLYDSSRQMVYMIPQDNNVLISHYIEFKNFQDDNDFIHPTYYLLVSALINTQTLKTDYYVNTLQSFAPPTKAGKGIKVDDGKDAALQALIMLEHVGFSSLIDRTPIPTHQEHLNRINWNAPKEWIKSVKITDHDSITVTFTNKVNDKNLQDAINHFTVDLKTSIIPNNYRMGIKNRKYKDGKNYVVEYIFTLPDAQQRKEIRLDAKHVNSLKNMFNMTDKQAAELIKHFNNM